MDTTNVDVDALFSRETQYIIPLFQRHYVWTDKEQWKPLWDDIKEKADQRLTNEHPGGYSAHFTGAIVIQQKISNADVVKQYEIIDGQQRLTTFQIILCALRDICESYKFDVIKRQTERYLQNEVYDPNNEQPYKLIPTDFDRDSFISLIDESVGSNGKEPISRAYAYFKKQIKGYVDGDEQIARRLFRSIQHDFGFVCILLDSYDKPEKIFESLNARGKPLLQFDLLRNNLFMRAPIEDRDSLYEDYWKDFESPYWESEVRVGKTKIMLSELFFQHFLIAKLGDENVTPLFSVYQRNLSEKNDVQYELSDLKRYSKEYRNLRDYDSGSDIELAMSVFKVFDIATLYPFLLFLRTDLGGVSDSDFFRILHILESFTMRRLLCFKLNATKSYTQLFSRLIGQLSGKRFSLGEFIDILSNEKAKSSMWPSDSEVKTFLTLGVDRYGASKNVIRYILYRVECMKRKENDYLETDELVFDNRLSLEHVMPEAWQKTWALPLDMRTDRKIYYKDLFTNEYKENDSEWQTNPSKDGLADESYEIAYNWAKLRSETLHSIGNLTLVTSKLNSKMSNRPFCDKRPSLSENSMLILNKEICNLDVWDWGCIRDRTEDLFTYFCSMWPSSEDFKKK